MSIFPRLGCPEFTFPIHYPDPEHSFTRSLFWPNEATFQGHPRFKTLSRNIRERRGEKVAINIPVYKDINTDLSKDVGSRQPAALKDHVYCDAMGFGMGLSCLQITFQAVNFPEAVCLYDQLAPLCPILLALTAASPIHRGYLTDVDCRWDVISASVDCRTRQERGLEPLKTDKFVIPKSRYASISSYLSDCSKKFNSNDIELQYDPEIYRKLIDNDVDDLMAKHISHLFIRDTVSLFSEKIHQNDDEDTDHFENIQSTNWQTMRFKPPPPKSNIGWRVEFRPCELQFTDFENAAIVCFVVLLTRAILSYKTNLLIPISKVDENMTRAQRRDAVTGQKFHFRSNISATCDETVDPNVREMTVDEILNGSEEFTGLIALIQEYLNDLDVDADTMCTLSNYWQFLRKRASGELMTNAKYMREFVLKHSEYGKDSVVSDRINYDLLMNIDDILTGKIKVPELMGNFKTKSKD